MIKLSIVTVYRFGHPSSLARTIQSVRSQEVPPFEHILVLSGVDDPDYVEHAYARDQTHMLINQDHSIYHAMNLGLQMAAGDAVLFLNGGDLLLDDGAIRRIADHYEPGRCLAMRTVQVYDSDAYIRPANSRMADLRRSPSHQAFVAPLSDAKSIPFDEQRHISADSRWMQALIARCGLAIDSSIIAQFHLGGVSNYPTLQTVNKRLHDAGWKRSALELLKWLMRSLLGSRNYYYLLLRRKCDRIPLSGISRLAAS